MKYFSILLIIILGCQSNEQSEVPLGQNQSDTIVVTYDMNQELAGSAYRKRATGYSMVIKGDSSLYRPALTESKDGSVSLMLDLHPLMTYSDQLNQLRYLLPFMAKSYKMDSLIGIYVGRLVDTGELAIDITNEYLVTNGGYGSTATTEYRKISRFLVQSKLGRDFNMLFEPYDLEVSDVSVEKVFFTHAHRSLNMDSTKYTDQNIPRQILDCMTWVQLRKKDSSYQTTRK